MMDLTVSQLERLSELFIDIAKGMFLAALAIPVIAPVPVVAGSIRSTIVGLFFTLLSLKALELKEVVKE